MKRVYRGAETRINLKPESFSRFMLLDPELFGSYPIQEHAAEGRQGRGLTFGDLIEERWPSG